MAICALHGIGVSRGYAIGPVVRLQRAHADIVEQRLAEHQIDPEIERLKHGLEIARQELRTIRDRLPDSMPTEIGAFIDTHLLMLEDSLLARVPLDLIRQYRCNAEWALKLQRDRIVRVFEDMEDAYLRARRDDIDHVITRVQRILLSGSGEPDTGSNRFSGRIVVADDLAPSDAILMQHQGVRGFVTEYGGPLSHTAILARSLGIPALAGVRQARRWLRDDETVVVDGHCGVVLADLEPAQLNYYHRRQRAEQRRRAALRQFKDRPAISRDGQAIELQANIELPDDTWSALSVDAAGVGLYRTEFLFMNRDQPPDEEEQYQVYRE
ncbi:MAG: phosphoenolpyruvate-utilizing N-terminal domain-containing protein, partial [Candidatus Competibacterales bacterium]|nr:phosphoenolpyruvate-utilizing N-terminal domain-containing protein [Candidatus Competibacterales bacterium]